MNTFIFVKILVSYIAAKFTQAKEGSFAVGDQSNMSQSICFMDTCASGTFFV
jgi:hypothetical protein